MPKPIFTSEIRFAVANAMAEVDPGAYTEQILTVVRRAGFGIRRATARAEPARDRCRSV